ncbi:MAG TPA: GGDEF domain-containing protein [Verrucomicrobiae bacterium]|nr:GGDEF domain-containing protein [Verrucomicrobiae bacterium]
MYLDTRTMLFSFATGSLIMAVGLLIANLRAAHMRVMTLWVTANFALFAGWGLYALRGIIPGFESVVVGFAFFVTGYALEFAALSLFCARRVRPRLLIALAVAAVAVHTGIHLANPADMLWGIVSSSLIIAGWFTACALTLAMWTSPQERISHLMTAGFFAALAIANAARAVYVLLRGDPTITLISNGLMQSIVLAVDYVGLFGTSLGFILMTKERADNELIRTASLDSLTGLFNRRSFMELAQRELHRAERQHLQTSVLMLDLDHFKDVNDTYGHSTGDFVLASFADVLRSGLRPFDIVGRYGGEEFCVLLPGTGIGEATTIAERIRNIAGQSRVEARTVTIPYTVSIGVVQAPPRVIRLEDLVDRADKALYQAKASGRNCVRAV